MVCICLSIFESSDWLVLLTVKLSQPVNILKSHKGSKMEQILCPSLICDVCRCISSCYQNNIIPRKTTRMNFCTVAQSIVNVCSSFKSLWFLYI